MEIKILEEKENPFFERKQLKLILKHTDSATPPKAELVKDLATSQKVDATCILVDYIFTKKGLNESVAKVKIYKDASKVPKPKEVKEEVAEEKPKEKKVEEKPKEEKPKVEEKPKEEKPKEEKAQDKPKEDKKEEKVEKNETQTSKTE